MTRPNVYSPKNSTSTPLGAGETFTGGKQDVSGYDGVSCAGLADQDGTLFMEFSTDAVNWDSSLPYPVAAGIPFLTRLTAVRRYYRVRFINGPVAQTVFRMQCHYGAKQLLTSPLHLSVLRTADTIIAKTLDMERLIALGKVDGFASDTKFGLNTTINAASTPEDVWRGGDIYTGQPTGSAETVEVFSDSADDDAAGTGMRTARLFGLDGSGLTQTEDVTLDGLTPVVTTLTWSRLPRVRGLTYGSGGINAGTITVRHTTTTANVFAQVAPGTGSTEIAAFTVPADHTGLITRFASGIGRNQASGSAFVTLRARVDGSGGYNVLREYRVGIGDRVDREYGGGIPIASLTDIKVTVEEVTANGSAVDAEIDYILVKNT